MSTYSTETTAQEKKDLFKDASEVTVHEVTRDEYEKETEESLRWRRKVGPFVIYDTTVKDDDDDDAVIRYAPTWGDVVTHPHPRFIRNMATPVPTDFPVTYTPQFHRAGDYSTQAGSSTA
jgi:hypothetical protein